MSGGGDGPPPTRAERELRAWRRLALAVILDAASRGAPSAMSPRIAREINEAARDLEALGIDPASGLPLAPPEVPS